MDTRVKTRNATIAYYLYFLMMNFAKGMGMSSSSMLYNAIFVAALGFLAIKLIYTRYTRRELFIMIVLVLMGLLFVLRARENSVLFAILALIGMKDIDFQNLMKGTFYVRLASLILIRFVCEYGILVDVDIDTGQNFRVLHSWGYSDANTLMVNIFVVLALFLYVYYESLNLIHILLALALAAYGFEQSYSRTGFLLFLLLLIVVWCDKFVKREWVRNAAYTLLSLMPLIIAVLSFVLPLIYVKTNVRMEAINQMLTGRIFIMNYYLKLYPFTLLGNTYEFWLANAGGILSIVDNLYVTLYMYSGVITMALYVAASCHVLFCLKRRHCYKELIMVSFMAIYAFMEEFPLNPVVNPFCLLLAMAIFTTNQPREIMPNEEEGCDYNKYSVPVSG